MPIVLCPFRRKTFTELRLNTEFVTVALFPCMFLPPLPPLRFIVLDIHFQTVYQNNPYTF
jgi:hypothetical protein